MPKKNVGTFFVLAYLIFRVLVDFHFINIGIPGAYGFELSMVLAALFYWKPTRENWQVGSDDFILVIILGLIGLFSAWVAKYSQMTIPFSLDSLTGFFLILIVAPLLEEGLFRWMLWRGLESLGLKKKTLLVANAFLFSLGHGVAFFFVPEEFKSFILFQSFYTFLLGLACGLALLNRKSLILAILLHFGFNLGFTFGVLF